MKKSRNDSPQYRIAKKKVAEIKGFYVHLVVYLFINVLIIVANSREFFFGDGSLEAQSFYTAFFWGIGLFAHWTSVFGPNIFFGKNWEERKAQELMEKERKKKQQWE